MKMDSSNSISVFSSGFKGVKGLAFDSAGNLYVAHQSGHILKVDRAGWATTYASGFKNPYGLTFDSLGNLYVTNFDGNSVSKVSTNGLVSTFATVNSPTGITIDASGTVYIADYNGGQVYRVGQPQPPSVVFASAVNSSCASISFSLNANNGGSEVLLCTAMSTPGWITGTSPGSSPIVVNGLNDSVIYSFNVYCTNAWGDSVRSPTSNPILLAARNCPAGWFWSNITSPEPCHPGTSTSGVSYATDCFGCDIGYYCPGGMGAQLCDSGFFCPFFNLSAPLPCSPGTYSAAGQSFCSLCPAGSYCNSVNGSVRVECPAGYFCPNTNLTAPIPCPDGLTSDTSAISCSICPHGQYCPLHNHLPVDCPAGFACSSGSLAPLPCTAGTYSSYLGVSQCLSCWADYFCPSNCTKPIACPSGYYCPTNSSSPLPCPEGYSCGYLSVYPVFCPIGSHCPALERGPIPCPTQYYCPIPSAYPLRCPEGYFCPGYNTSPVPCPGGSYCPAWVKEPIRCPAGTTSSASSTSCNVPCPNCAKGGQCVENASGPLCNNCASGYFHEGNSCAKCPSESWPSILFLIFVAALILFLYMMSSKTNILFLCTSVLGGFVQLGALILLIDVGWPSFVHAAYDWFASLNLHASAFQPECHLQNFHLYNQMIYSILIPGGILFLIAVFDRTNQYFMSRTQSARIVDVIALDKQQQRSYTLRSCFVLLLTLAYTGQMKLICTLLLVVRVNPSEHYLTCSLTSLLVNLSPMFPSFLMRRVVLKMR